MAVEYSHYGPTSDNDVGAGRCGCRQAPFRKHESRMIYMYEEEEDPGRYLLEEPDRPAVRDNFVNSFPDMFPDLAAI